MGAFGNINCAGTNECLDYLSLKDGKVKVGKKQGRGVYFLTQADVGKQEFPVPFWVLLAGLGKSN